MNYNVSDDLITIRKILNISQNDLAVYITGWKPVIFEKVKI